MLESREVRADHSAQGVDAFPTLAVVSGRPAHLKGSTKLALMQIPESRKVKYSEPLQQSHPKFRIAKVLREFACSPSIVPSKFRCLLQRQRRVCEAESGIPRFLPMKVLERERAKNEYRTLACEGTRPVLIPDYLTNFSLI